MDSLLVSVFNVQHDRNAIWPYIFIYLAFESIKHIFCVSPFLVHTHTNSIFHTFSSDSQISLRWIRTLDMPSSDAYVRCACAHKSIRYCKAGLFIPFQLNFIGISQIFPIYTWWNEYVYTVHIPQWCGTTISQSHIHIVVYCWVQTLKNSFIRINTKTFLAAIQSVSSRYIGKSIQYTIFLCSKSSSSSNNGNVNT